MVIVVVCKIWRFFKYIVTRENSPTLILRNKSLDLFNGCSFCNMNIFFLRIWLITFVWVNCLHVHTGLRKSLQSQKSWDLRLWRLWDVDVDRRLRGSPTLTSSTSATPTVTLQVSHSYSPHTHTHTPKKKNETSKVTLPVCQYLFPYKITPSKKNSYSWKNGQWTHWTSESVKQNFL